jgi:high-affinity iron transporter
VAEERRRRTLITLLAAVCAAAGVFALISALGTGTPAKPPAAPVRNLYAVLAVESPHVASSYTFYSVIDGSGALAPSAPTVKPPLAPGDFDAPVAAYRSYAKTQLGRLEVVLGRLEAALGAGSRAAAKRDWSEAYGLYLRLGAVYLVGPLATLNQEIDGTPGGLPGGVENPRFTGLHRLEYGLWSGAAPQSLLGFTRRLRGAVERMRGLLGGVSISPLEYATRAHEILEDVVRDQLSGADVPWSGEGVVATAAGLQATEEVIATLHNLLHGEDGENERPVGPVVETELAALGSVLRGLARAHGGRLPSNGQLTQSESISLNGTLGGALEALAAVPGVLEAEPRPVVPSIPSQDDRTDP